VNGVGDLVMSGHPMDKLMYSRIIKENVIPSGNRLIGNQFIYQDDNAPQHRAQDVINLKDELGVKSLKWPPQSPDLNPIENLWGHMKRQLKRRNPNSREDLAEYIRDEWEKIPKSHCTNLIHSLSKRMRDVIEAKGFHTKY